MPVVAAALQLALDAFCCFHIWRTGRPYWWAFVVLGFPVFGALAYIVFEVMPTANANLRVRRVIRHLTPDADFRARLDEVERCGSLANRLALADECINIGQFDDAIRIYRACMEGIHAEDLPATFGLANAYFWKGDAPNAVLQLRRVVEREPMFAAGEAKLMLARALAGAGRTDEARDAFEALLPHFPGEEARAYYIAFLARAGDRARAEGVMAELDKRFRLGGSTYRRTNNTWRRDAHKAFDSAFAG